MATARGIFCYRCGMHPERWVAVLTANRAGKEIRVPMCVEHIGKPPVYVSSRRVAERLNGVDV